MSDQSQGPGWWQASDGQWHAPELNPSAGSVPTVPTVHPKASNRAAALDKRDRPGRHRWLWALPVVAVCTVIAIVLSLVLGGAHGGSSDTATPASSSTSTSASTSTPNTHARAGTTDLTGTYVGVGEDNSLTMLLELTQSGNALAGTLIVNGSHYAPTLGNKPAQVTGEADPANATLAGSVPTFGLSFTGRISGTSLTLSLSRFGDPEDESQLNIVFRPGTVSDFRRLTTKSTPSVANAQVNLVNAVTAAKVLYQATGAYSTDAHTGQDLPYGLQAFAQQDPEFMWTTKECGLKADNCISERILDVASDNDFQGIALAVYSAQTSRCWYAIDIETSPRVLPNDRFAFVAAATDPNASVTAPGVYYARGPASPPSYCIASLVLHPQKAAWGSNFANAGVLS